MTAETIAAVAIVGWVVFVVTFIAVRRWDERAVAGPTVIELTPDCSAPKLPEFCRRCGQTLNHLSAPTGYDEKTGCRTFNRTLTCPDAQPEKLERPWLCREVNGAWNDYRYPLSWMYPRNWLAQYFDCDPEQEPWASKRKAAEAALAETVK